MARDGSCVLPISTGTHLRLLDEADAGELHVLIEANRGQLRHWLSWAAEQTFEDTLEFLRRCEGQLARNDGFQAAIVIDGAIAGAIGYVGVNWEHRSTGLGYWLGEEHQGRGTMTAAVRVLIDHAFSAWQLSRVEIRVAAENRHSRAIPERIGFCLEGTLRQAELVDGRYLDNVIYSMLAADWRAAG